MKNATEIVRTLWPPTQHKQWMSSEFKPGLVSVIVPTFNRSGMLKIALDSVWSQTYRPIELLIVDDGSTDDTEYNVTEWINTHKDDPVFTSLLIHQDNRGAPSARNMGLIISKGEFIQFFDSDDILHPQKIEIHKEMIERRPKCSMVWSKYNSYIIENGLPVFKGYDIENVVNHATYFESRPFLETGGNPRSTFYRRNLCVSAGPWNEKLNRWQDLEYAIRVSALSPNARYSDIPLAYEGIHNNIRISDMINTINGIDEGMVTLIEIENILSEFNITEVEKTRHRIANYYLSLATQAMKQRDIEKLKKALEGAIRNKNNSYFTFKAKLLLLIYRLFGAKIGILSATTYTKTRINK